MLLDSLVRDCSPLSILNLLTAANLAVLWRSTETGFRAGHLAGHALRVWHAGCVSILIHTVCTVILLRI